MPFLSRLSLLVLASMLSTSVHADWFHKLVGYKCDTKRDVIILTYVGAYNEAGEDMIKTKNSQQWDPWSLIETMRDDDHIGTLKTVQGQCNLKSGRYIILIGPTPGNANIQGRCGAHIAAWASVRRGTMVVLPPYEFEGDCHDIEKPITTELVVQAGAKKPLVKTLSWNEFYQ